MKIKIIAGAILSVALLSLIGVWVWGSQAQHQQTTAEQNSVVLSQYAGQETRGIKALSQEDIEGLLAGAGTPFGGMAKPAELNGYPGPRHVLDAAENGELELSGEQLAQINALYEEMRQEAIVLGEQIIEIEKEVDDAFLNNTITEQNLEEMLGESSNLYGQLRNIHLKHHLFMVDILTPQQVSQYNELRGYTSDDPCQNIPEGHDPDMWRLHNNCG